MENSKPLVILRITDKGGLHEACNRESKLYVSGATMYIAGSYSTQDWYDDLNIPFNKTDKCIRTLRCF